MIPAAFEYARATSLTDALTALGNTGTVAISGGQSLIPLMRFRRVQPARLIDIGQLDELRGIDIRDGLVRIGAATTYRELLDSAALRMAMPLVPEVVEYIGDLQLRNRGTLGGALAYADPFADLPAAMIALDAVFHLHSLRDVRRVPAREFFLGAFTTALLPGELLVTIELPALAPRTTCAYANFEKAASGYSQVGAAAVVTRDADGMISAAALAITSVSAAPFLAPAAQSLVGTDGSAAMVAQVVTATLTSVEIYPDPHVTPEYHRHLAQVAATRALRRAIDGAT